MTTTAHIITVAVAALGIALAACATARNVLDSTVTSDCIKKNCTDSEAHAYQTCEATCRSSYNK